jgi:predicted house-cleaning noncanonical NTP pyrophosphatase (MazG superfamily)
MKLVRDKIPEIIEKSGKKAITHIANDKEYLEGLNMKLKEEVDEFLKDGNDEELMDIVEVIEAMAGLKGASFEEFEKKRRLKAEERGKFKRRIILDSVK